MFHCDGWCLPWGVTAMIGTHVCLRKVESGQIWDLLEAERVTHYCAAPNVQIELVNHDKAHRMDWEVSTAIGGAPPSPTLLARFQDLNIRPIQPVRAHRVLRPHLRLRLARGLVRPPGRPAGGDARAPGTGPRHLAHRAGRRKHMNDVPRDGQTLGEIVIRATRS